MLLTALLCAAGSAAAAATMTVYKAPACACCDAWVERVRAAGLEVDARDGARERFVEHKRRPGVDPGFAACHTAVIDGYVIEGHVPAADIRRLLSERPRIAGLAVAGMPAGSPGMGFGGRDGPYRVVALDAAGGMRIFPRHGD